MTYKEIVDYLFNLPRFTKGGHMDNVKKLLEALGNPQESFRYIHVAGTNGKGSVCAYIERCLRLCHKKTGLFTSPHLVKVNERIRICGREISDQDFVRIFERVHSLAQEQCIKGCAMPTFFEYIYLMAMVYFREERIDYGIIEAGLGGRLDFTNAVVHPRLSVITSVSLDHVPVLGNSLPEIAEEKAGIIKEGTPLICACQADCVKEIIKKYADRFQVKAVYVSDEDFEILSDNGKNIDFSWKSGYHGSCIFTLNTSAVYQVENASVAAAAMEELWEEVGETDFCKILCDGLKLTRWPGRMELLDERFIVDGAHNEAGAEAFADTIRQGFKNLPLYLIFAVADDKDYESMIVCLASISNLQAVIITEIQNGRRCSAEKVLKVFKKNWNGIIYSTYNIKEAVKMGLSMRGDDGILCCVGSLYLVGSIKEITGGNSDDQL